MIKKIVSSNQYFVSLKQIFIILSAGLVIMQAAFGQSVAFPREILTIEKSTGGQITLSVEVATTNQQRQQGLMFRQSMPADHGMIFFFNRPQIVSMWMRNTYLPLDMLFIDQQGKIIAISNRVIPQSDNLTVSPKPVVAVLEINGGASERLGLKTGDRILHAFFTPVIP